MGSCDLLCKQICHDFYDHAVDIETVTSFRILVKSVNVTGILSRAEGERFRQTGAGSTVHVQQH